MKKLFSFLILTVCMLALLSVVASAVTLETEITAGSLVVSIDEEVEWTIEITICAGEGENLEGVVVQGGIGADLVIDEYTPEAGAVDTEKKGKGKMGATIVKWDIGTLASNNCLTLELVILTGLNPKDYQEYTSVGFHELDGGFSATYWLGGIEYETEETIPLTVEAVEE